MNEADLAELLWRASRGESCEHLRPRPTTKRSGRRSGRVETYVAAAGNTSNTQDAGAERPTQDTIQLKRTAWSRVQELRSPPKHRVMAVVDVDAWASHPHTSDGPVPYWLAVCRRAVTPNEWLGRSTDGSPCGMECNYLETPSPVLVDGQTHWEYRDTGTDVVHVPYENVLCQLPELDGVAATDGFVTVTPKLHQRCLAAARRHTSVHLHVGEFTSAVDRCGEYSVRCVQDADPGASPESALRSHGISAKALAGAELTVRITEARLRMLPYGLPLPEQPAVLRLPGGVQAHGTIRALPPTPDSVLVVGFEASMGRGAMAYKNLRRVDNIHGLNGVDAKRAEEQRIEQNRRDLQAQGMEHETAPLGHLRQDNDTVGEVIDQAKLEYELAITAKQLLKDAVAGTAPQHTPLTLRALAGLAAASARQRVESDVGTSPLAPATAILPTSEDKLRALSSEYDRFKTQISRANTQTHTAAATCTQLPAPAQQPASAPPPPLARLPPDGDTDAGDAELTTGRPSRCLSLEQTLKTGAPDAGAGTPYGAQVNAGQGEGIANILSALSWPTASLGFETAGAKVGTAPSTSAVFGGVVAKSFSVIGEPGTGKSVVASAVRRHLESHGWTHAEFRVVCAMGIAASHVHGSTFASFKAQAGNRMPLPEGVAQRARPPGVEPVFDEPQKKRLRERLGGLRLLMVDEYEMQKLEDYAMLNAMLKAAKGSDKPFGGVFIVLFGDPF